MKSSPPGNAIFCFSQNPSGCDARSGACHSSLAHGRGAVSALAWHPSNSTLLTAGADGAAHLWDVRTLKKRGSLDRHDLSGAPASINDRVAKTAHDGGLRLAAFGDTSLITAGADDRLRAWDSETGAFVSDAFAPVQIPVSYTHLTLPTKA